MIFYTADLHFHYEPFLPSRPFGSVEEMDRVLIARWGMWAITGAWCRGTRWRGSGAIST